MLKLWSFSEVSLEQGTTGCEQIRQGLRILRETGAIVAQRLGAALLAEAYSKDGRVEEGLVMVNEVLRTLEQPGERLWDAELYRLKGILLLAQESKSQKSKGKSQKSKMTDPRPLIPDPQAEAEVCFLKAIEIALQQQAKLWELRATMSLARLWQQQSKHYEALKILSTIYNWFTEGFDTKDLQESKALLNSLGSSA